LLDGGGNPFEREVLASAHLDKGSKRGLNRVLATVGAATVATRVAEAGTLAAPRLAEAGTLAKATCAAPLAATTVTKAASVAWISIVSWLAGGVLAGAGVTQWSLFANQPASVHAVARQRTPEGENAAMASTNGTNEPLAIHGQVERESGLLGAPSRGLPSEVQSIEVQPMEPERSIAERPIEVAQPIEVGPPLAAREPLARTSDARAAKLAPRGVRTPPAVDGTVTSAQMLVASAEQPRAVASGPLPEPPRAARSTLAEEIALLVAARSAMVAGAPRQALERVDAYLHVFPRGSLTDEATVLRLQAWRHLGECERASSAALAFLERASESPHAPEVRRIMAACRSGDRAKGPSE
jgi:hypothetical protein